MTTILDRVRDLGERMPTATAIAFVDDRGRVTDRMSRADAVTEMEEVANFVSHRCGLASTDRALLVFPPGLDFVRGLLGCLAAGVPAVPVYPPDPLNPNKSIEHLRRVVADCSPKAVLTNRNFSRARWLDRAKGAIMARPSAWPAALTWHVIPTAFSVKNIGSSESNAKTVQHWSPGQNTPALLQYTSGSTSDPKGVVITHGNLVHQLDLNRRCLGLDSDSRSVVWLPPYHDFGLISAILSALAGNGELTLISPISFIQRPALWFELMDRVRATHTAAPNFAYELAVRKTSAQQRAGWDLSSLKVLMSAAEPVRADTTERFLRAFSVTGLHPEAFCPAYGLAEHTVGVTMFGRSTMRVDRELIETEGLAVPAQGPDCKVLMSCGKPTDDVDVRIVDPKLLVPLADGRVGEIWVDSPSKAAGYWAAPEASQATFQARLTGEQDEYRTYLRTGDLGFLSDGELYVCGRIKDLLIVAGRKIHPEDVEENIRGCHPSIRPGGVAAFAFDVDHREALAVVVEVQAKTSRAVLPSVAAAVRAAVLEHHQLRCSFVVVGPPGSVSKTTSGKVQRSRCRARFLDGSLQAQALLVDRSPDDAVDVSPVRDARNTLESLAEQVKVPVRRSAEDLPGRRSGEDVIATVRQEVAAVLRISATSVDIDKPLGAQGLNSVGVVELAARLTDSFGSDVYAVDVFNHPTVAGLAQLLRGGDRAPESQTPTAGGRHAVVGAGCAGLAAAAQLLEQGATEVVLFEAEERVGGKVFTYTDEHGRVVELGQVGFSWKCQRSLSMAGRLGLQVIPSLPGLSRLHGSGVSERLELGPELVEAARWSQQVMAAAGVVGPVTLVALSNRKDLGVGITTWLRQHALPAPPLVWRHWWTGFGYGPLDDSTPAAYIVALASLTDEVAEGPNAALAGLCISGGNDRLWTATLEGLRASGRLQWRPSCPVRGLDVTDGGVMVWTDEGQSGRFDQVVLACPPWEARSLLPTRDQRRHFLSRFHSYNYIVTLFAAEDLEVPDGYNVLGESELSIDGRPLQLVALGSCHFLVGQYGIDGDDSRSIAAIRELSNSLGGRFDRVIRRVSWPYFPHLTPEDWDAGVLDKLHRDQGRDGIVLVGSYLGFEMVEHTLAHAQTTLANMQANATPQSARRTDDPVAIVGMACRFAGGVKSPADLWDLLVSGSDAVGPFPTDRGWDLTRLFDPDPDAMGKTYTEEGAFLSDAAGFDAEFFGISPREARAMDPQQRQFLEVCYEALESAGIDPSTLAGTNTGVFVGASPQLYGSGRSDSSEGFALTGLAPSVISGRVAYQLGLQGPAITVDTACSSSLVAIHLACQSLRESESSLALAGGVNVMTTPAMFTEFARQRGLARDGRCKAFAAAADGTGWGEGVAVLVLERLSEARAQNRRVLGIVAGSAVNQDGATNGLTAPSGLAQQRVIRQAATQAGIRLDQVDVVEAHGTGTTLGDSIEAAALIATYGVGRDQRHPLWVGSVKSNIGHTQAAAGAAGVIKMLLALEHDTLPQTLHIDHPSPRIDWSAGTVQPLSAAVAWSRTNRTRIAGVSSFGISGTNAHLILREAPAGPAPAKRPVEKPSLLMWPISARSRQALAAQAERLLEHLNNYSELDLTDLAYSLGVTRTQHLYRATIIAHAHTDDPRQELKDALRALVKGNTHPCLTHNYIQSARPGKIVFVFPGQGAQYPEMGMELARNHRGFSRALEQVCAALDNHLAIPLREIMFAAPGTALAEMLNQTAYAQPALFAMGVAIHSVLTECGIHPDYLLGHSVGELTAAYIAGVLSLTDAAMLVTARGRLMQACSPGSMVAIAASENEVKDLLADHPQAAIAAINGPNSVVVSGPSDDLKAVSEICAERRFQVTPLKVSHAFHSSAMDPALGEFYSIADRLTLRAPNLPILSNLTGGIASAEQLTSAGYWTRQLRDPVRFYDSVSFLMTKSDDHTFVELSPHPVLAPAIIDAIASTNARTRSVVITTLHRGCSDIDRMTAAVAELHTHGHSPSWRALYPRANTISLPTYAFQHQSYWLTPTYLGAGRDPAEEALWKAIDDDAVDSAAQILGLRDVQDTVPLAAVIRALRRLHRDLGLRSPSSTADRTGDLLTDVPTDRRVEQFDQLVLAEIGEALGMPAPDLDPTAELIALGMNSLIAMQLRRRLNAVFGIELPASLFSSGPTVSELTERLRESWLDKSARQELPIRRADRSTSFPRTLPLSHAQKQLWFLNQLSPLSTAYNVAIRVDIRGELNRDALRRSFDAVIARHEVLRTTFPSLQGVPQAVLAESAEPFSLPCEQLGSDEEVNAAAVREANVPFDIGAGRLLRARLFELAEHRHVLVLTMHHIVTDGWSFRVLVRELDHFYRAFDHGEPVVLRELPIQYSDYAQWQLERVLDDQSKVLIEYWKKDLQNAPQLELDTDRPRTSNPTFEGERIEFELGRERALALGALCRTKNFMLSVPLMAAFAALLHIYSHQEDVVIGTVSASRGRPETDDLIGLFANALPVRIRLDGNPDIGELLERVRQRMVDAFAHEEVPFAVIVNAAAADRDVNRNPLFQVQLLIQPAHDTKELGGLRVEVAEIDTRTAKRDLTLTIVDDDPLTGHAEYATKLFDSIRIDQLIAHFKVVIDAILSNRGQLLSDLTVFTRCEQAQHLRSKRLPRTMEVRSVHELFERSVDQSPDAVAVIAYDGALTYRDLDYAANRLAHRLRRLGVRAGTAVGLCVDRSCAIAIGMLGIMKAGGVYVPLDPSYPRSRIARLVADAAVGLVVDDEVIKSDAVSEESADRLGAVTCPDDIAYVMYTSGSTGRPKGVAISHGSVIEYVQTLGREIGVTADDVYLETASIGFSSSIRQLLVPFSVGAQVVVATNDERHDATALISRIRESSVSIVDLVPTVVSRIVDLAAAAPPDQREQLLPNRNRLRMVLTASEPLSVGVVSKWRELIGSCTTWINMYGQTETTGIVSLYRVHDVSSLTTKIVPIGRPRANVDMYVLDKSLRPVPPGVTGELYLGGVALAQGYISDSALTAQKFVSAPDGHGQRLYATGDLVRIGWGGTLEFLGRSDQQVKIRGMRVSPIEIDCVLLEHPGVRAVVTVAQDRHDKSPLLVSYFVPEEKEVSVDDLRAHARRHLPEQMVPAVFVELERLPQTPSGKLDREALPAIAIGREVDGDYLPPRPGVESTLAALWRDLLDVGQVGAYDNFFALGGDSLVAAEMRARLHQLLGVELPLEAFFENQTLADLARRIEAGGTDKEREAPTLISAKRNESLPASYAQERMWRAEHDDPGSPANWIDVFLRIRGPVDAELLVCTMREIVQRHELFRTIFRSTGTALSQIILDSYLPDVPILEPQQDANAALGQETAEVYGQDLEVLPPFQTKIVRLDEADHILRLHVHRILADGFSMRMLTNTIVRLVTKSAGLIDIPLPGGRLHYADYAAWERSWLVGDALERRVDYFCRQFANCDLDCLAAFPPDRPRADQPHPRWRQFSFKLPTAAANNARSLAASEQTTLYTVLLAAFAVALGTYASRRTVVIASPVTLRTNSITQQMLGPLMNTVPIRIDLQDAQNGLHALIQQVKTKVVGSLSNRDAPWQNVLAALVAHHGTSALGIGDVGFVMDDPAPVEFSCGGFTITRVPSDRIIGRRKLTAAVTDHGGQISGTVTYSATTYETKSIERIVTNFVTALELWQSK